MKKKSLIVDNTKKQMSFPVKLIITIALIVLCIVMIVYSVKVYLINEEFAESVAEIARLNSKTREFDTSHKELLHYQLG